MKNSQYKTLLEEVRSIKQKVDDIEDAEAKDREKLQDQNVELADIKTRLENLARTVNRSSETTKNKVADVVKPAVNAVNNMTTAVESAVKGEKVVVVRKEGVWEKLCKKFGKSRAS